MGRIAAGFDGPGGPAIRTHLKGILSERRLQLTCVADIDRQRALSELRRFGVEANVESPEALAAANIDVVCIASPDETHIDFAERAAAGHARVVLVEKPLGGTQEQRRGIVDRCAARGADLSVDHTRRWIPNLSDWVWQARSGAFGRPISGVVHYSRGFQHNGIHAFDLVGAFFGTDAESVQSIAPPIGDYASHDPTYSLVVTMNVAERGIPLAVFGVDGRIQTVFSVELRFERARVHVFDQNGIRAELHRKADSGFSGFASELCPVESFHDDPARLFGVLWSNIADHLERKAALACAGTDALIGYELMERILARLRA